MVVPFGQVYTKQTSVKHPEASKFYLEQKKPNWLTSKNHILLPEIGHKKDQTLVITNNIRTESHDFSA